MSTTQQDLEATLRDELEGFRRAMERRAAIEQAKGVLMFLYQLDDSHAFSILQRWSMQSNLKLRDLAVALLEVCVQGNHSPTDRDPARMAVRAALRRADCTGTDPYLPPVLREA
ncbi:ANTAR domain-containing protein [Aeromicrobium stalagmiti]|uniref:ANTAR domain-containing protein n=1 Tax=Aeromicrobium stalagmiti TaxID=2738988 RepID=UPI0015689A10|nr:ANTAR domain-containing protein [Aeromicrobium stalagmiti]NRQ49770.1 ANTAR domain-containing protein [Aeromicrobium stalagmiti]